MALALCAAISLLLIETAHADDNSVVPGPLSNLRPFGDPEGVFTTFSPHGFIDQANPFFQDLGTNGRRCVTCHQPADGWTVTPPHIRARFEATRGREAIFRLHDGAGCPSAAIDARSAPTGLSPAARQRPN